jgi:CHAT domain-containing protein/uncharacterized protein HemY
LGQTPAAPVPADSQAAASTQVTAEGETQLAADTLAQLEKLQDDLKGSRAAGDAAAEGKTLYQIGDLYSSFLNYPGALEYYGQALPIFRQTGDRNGEAVTLLGMTLACFGLGEKQKALDYYIQLLPVYRAMSDRKNEANTLITLGNSYVLLGENQKALDFYYQALPVLRAVGDRKNEAGTLANIGRVYSGLGEEQKALDFDNQALPVFQAVGDRDGEAKMLMGLGNVYSELGEKQKALDFDNQALTAFQALGDREMEATTLRNMGIIYDDLDEKQKALDFYNQAMPVLREVGDRDGEAEALIGIGNVEEDLGEERKALDFYNQALPVLRAVGNRKKEAGTLGNIGFVYSKLGDPQRALDFYNQALPVLRAVGDRDGAATTLNNIGSAYGDLGEPQKALDFYNQALPILRAVGDRKMEGGALMDIGNVYFKLGEPQKALDFYNQALPVSRAVRDRHDEARTLIGVGNVYSELGEKQKALNFYNQALPLLRAVRDSGGEAITLGDVGIAHANSGEPQKALDFYNQALPLFRAVEDREGEAINLGNIGNAYSDLGEKQKALDFYNQALPLAAAISDPLTEAAILRNLMLNRRAQQPALAIFYGKQAVNFLQRVRGNIQGLDLELQKSFLSSNENSFHMLADLLIDQGRLPEAQEVLDLLKQQEYTDYVRGEASNNLSPLTLTPAEKQAEEDYRQSTSQLVSLGEHWAQLKKIASRTPEEEKQYQELSDQLDKASKGLNDYYARIYVLFGKNSDANKQVADVKGEVSLLKQTIAKMPHTVALYTLVGKDRTSVIVIAGSTAVARESAISEKDLNKKVADFQQVLRDPATDPKPAAQELYKILIGPVKADLDQAGAQTLVWSLDGVLRYIPIAALYDGKQYLVESYNTVTITPVSIPHLSEKPDLNNMNAAAMGISRKYEDGLPALPAVTGELDEIVKDAQVKGANGVLPGRILLNGEFTEKAMETQLGSQHAVVHIASHFVFKPGDDSQSYLLLAGKDEGGSGYHLTVADFRDNQRLALDDTDLLTLSACETGMSGNASNGREVDGLGTTVQLKGAKAVISSLWSVNDSSTGQLMADFYQRWAVGAGKVEKVEALRQAQLDLLLGKANLTTNTKDTGVAPGSPIASVNFAHPYYWAPFVLMGNWR